MPVPSGAQRGQNKIYSKHENGVWGGEWVYSPGRKIRDC